MQSDSAHFKGSNKQLNDQHILQMPHPGENLNQKSLPQGKIKRLNI